MAMTWAGRVFIMWPTTNNDGGTWLRFDNKGNLHPFGKHRKWQPKNVRLRPPKSRILPNEINFEGPAPNAVDASRSLVPKRLENVFHGRQRMVEWAAHLHALKLEVLNWKTQPFSVDLDIEGICQQIETIRARVLQAAPWCVCGCENNDACPYCESKRWLSTGKYLKKCIAAQRHPLSESLQSNQPSPPQQEASNELPGELFWSI